MGAVLDWINHASVAWWNYIVHSSWQAAVVGAGLLLVVRLCGRRWPAPLRYALLVLALLKFACPPLLPLPTGLFSHLALPPVILPATSERKPTQATAFHAAEPAQRDGTGGLTPSSGPLTPSSVFPSHERPLVHWSVWLMALHLLGAAALVLSIVRQAARLRRISRSAQVLLGGDFYRDLALHLNLSRIPALAVSDEVDGPIAFGVRRPVIILPTRILGSLKQAELKAVLAHELAHCQRGDLWLNWVQLILLAVWWFHPVLWLLNESVREVREDCCDDLLLAREVISNDAYCDVLLHAAAEMSPATPLKLSAALGFGGGVHPLGRRMVRINDWTLQRSEQVSLAGATVVLISAALLLPGLKSGEPPSEPGPPVVSAESSASRPPRVVDNQPVSAQVKTPSTPLSSRSSEDPLKMTPSVPTVRAPLAASPRSSQPVAASSFAFAAAAEIRTGAAPNVGLVPATGPRNLDPYRFSTVVRLHASSPGNALRPPWIYQGVQIASGRYQPNCLRPNPGFRPGLTPVPRVVVSGGGQVANPPRMPAARSVPIRRPVSLTPRPAA